MSLRTRCSKVIMLSAAAGILSAAMIVNVSAAQDKKAVNNLPVEGYLGILDFSSSVRDTEEASKTQEEIDADMMKQLNLMNSLNEEYTGSTLTDDEQDNKQDKKNLLQAGSNPIISLSFNNLPVPHSSVYRDEEGNSLVVNQQDQAAYEAWKNASTVIVSDDTGNSGKGSSGGSSSGSGGTSGSGTNNSSGKTSGTGAASGKSEKVTYRVGSTSVFSTTEAPGQNASGNNGPGNSGRNGNLVVEESSTFKGPQVQNVTLSETYHEEYGVYSECIGGIYYFYTNAGNNSMTDQAVIIDFPANMQFTLEKDGVPTPYTSKQKLSERGTYLFRIVAVDDNRVPVSQQNIYKTTYNFRIQDKVPKKVETGSANSGSASSSADPYTTDIFAQRSNADAGDSYYSNLISKLSEDDTEKITDEDLKDLTPEELKELTSELGEDEYAKMLRGVDDTEAEADLDAFKEAFSDQAASSDGTPVCTYDRNSGLYITRYDDNSAFGASLPNGMISNNGVAISTDQLGDMTCTITRDGAEIDVPSDGFFSDPGSYVIVLRDGDRHETYQFRILSEYSDHLESWTVPEGMYLTAVRIDGNDQLPERYRDSYGRYILDFEEDGVYELELQDENERSFSVKIQIENGAPEFYMETRSDGSVAFQYDPSKVDHIELDSKGGTQILDSIQAVNTKGKYAIRFYGRSGEYSSAEFTVKRKMNTASIITLVMSVVLISVACGFIIKLKNRFNTK